MTATTILWFRLWKASGGRMGSRGWIIPTRPLSLDQRDPSAGLVTQEDFEWAVAEATRKKKLDCSIAEL